MSSTTSAISTASATSTSAAASATSTDTTYDFSIKEATIRNTAIGVCLALFVFLCCALVGLEILRRRLKRMRRQLLRYASLEEEGGFRATTQYLSPSSQTVAGGGGGSTVKMETGFSATSTASSDDVRYQLVSPAAMARQGHGQRERSATEVSVQGEVFESDARSVRSFHRGDTYKHNKNVAGKWYDLRGHVHRDG